MSRQIERAVARREYADFCQRWSRERRALGSTARKPTFKEWTERFRRAPPSSQRLPVILEKSADVDPWKEEDL